MSLSMDPYEAAKIIYTKSKQWPKYGFLCDNTKTIALNIFVKSNNRVNINRRESKKGWGSGTDPCETTRKNNSPE